MLTARRRVLLAAAAQPRRVLPRAPVDDLAAGRPVADGGARQRDRLPDAAVGDDQVRADPAHRHLVVAVSVSVGRARDAAVLPAAELLHRVRVSRGAVRRARAQRSPPASSSSGASAGWRRRFTCRASRSPRRPAGGFRSTDDGRSCSGCIVTLYTALGGVAGGDLERRHSVLRALRRPGRGRGDRGGVGAGRPRRDLARRATRRARPR